ncbi:RNA polymerase sigma factor [Crateriforma conspicua]|uniref:RNA polymerase sigma factor n=1 Tax=Crateriforma conspicua TaxID=2527996 RepID=A0A5C5Y6S2_9PLAN|nr:sigma-70 family RNA polymerase sigma factor [Crateriforma conspicua]QDV65968.1 RNA polymerase sigma factor [Crateriforma conspicua]TWT71336.1 RNA polymerase sigma factor [Crateriforma conspicua]
MHPDDARWIEDLRGGGPDHDAAVLRLHQVLARGLSKAFANRLRGPLQADDVAQDAMVKILATIDQFEGRSRLTTWAMAVAIRIAVSELRRKHHDDVSLDAVAGPDRLVVPDQWSDRQMQDTERDDVLRLLRRLIDTELTDRQRGAINGLLDGMTIESVAESLGSNRNAIYKLVHDARLRLKVGFESAGLMPEDIQAVIA